MECITGALHTHSVCDLLSAVFAAVLLSVLLLLLLSLCYARATPEDASERTRNARQRGRGSMDYELGEWCFGVDVDGVAIVLLRLQLLLSATGTRTPSTRCSARIRPRC